VSGGYRHIAHVGVLPLPAGVALSLKEVVPVLDPHEKLVFDGMVNQLRDEDPSFLRKIERISRPRRNLRIAAAVLLWTLAPISIVFGGWTGLLLAVLAVSYGAFLVTKQGGMRVPPAWWSASGRRPPATSL
jgi:hypothetical protein